MQRDLVTLSISSAGQPAADAPVASPSLRVVTMRVDSASLLMNNEDEWAEIGRGLVLHISFFSTATHAGMRKAVRKLLRLPLLSRGKWGDEHEPESVLKLAPDEGGIDVLVVPQANLTGAPSSSSNSVRYTDQLPKDAAREMYKCFCDEISIASAEALRPAAALSGAELEAEIRAKEARNSQDPSLTFKTGEFAGVYSAFDERGVPTHDAQNAPLSKAALKKCEKIYKTRAAKYAKAVERGDAGGGGVAQPAAAEAVDAAAAAPATGGGGDAAPLGAVAAAEAAGTVLPRVVCGVFGNRQGFRCVSAGPTIHCFDL